MSKFKIFCVLAIVALIAAPAFAEVQNVKVSGDLSARWLIRGTYDLDKNGGTGGDSGDDFLQSAAEVQVDADLTDKVSATIAIINERAWGQNDESSSAIDLNLAYVTMKEMLYSPLTVTVLSLIHI